MERFVYTIAFLAILALLLTVTITWIRFPFLFLRVSREMLAELRACRAELTRMRRYYEPDVMPPTPPAAAARDPKKESAIGSALKTLSPR
ncbi:MAG TPA: hypothetical protein VK474_11585 [Chthoniobacterales bacterium]|nr:hypothetical protein [Chthoniobacterales bacterium]